MADKQVLIVVLLIISIIFSVASILLALSLNSYSVPKFFSQEISSAEGKSSGGVSLVIEPKNKGGNV